MNKDLWMPLVLALLAGLSTLIGAVIVLFTKKKSYKLLTFSLGFAAGVMLSISLLDLFPIALEEFLTKFTKSIAVLLTSLFFIVGVLFAGALEKFVPVKELEGKENSKDKKLFRVAFISMLALAIHNFPEGMATFVSGYKDISLGLSVALAIALHNIPEGISIAVPIYHCSKSKKKAFLYTFIAAISEPIGALFAALFLTTVINGFIMGVIFASIAGMMVFIALNELLPTSLEYNYPRFAIISTLIGICIVPFTLIF